MICCNAADRGKKTIDSFVFMCEHNNRNIRATAVLSVKETIGRKDDRHKSSMCVPSLMNNYSNYRNMKEKYKNVESSV